MHDKASRISYYSAQSYLLYLTSAAVASVIVGCTELLLYLGVTCRV